MPHSQHSLSELNAALAAEDQVVVKRSWFRIDYAALLRKLIVVCSLLGVWEVAARLVDSPQLLPGVAATMGAIKSMMTIADDTTLQGYVFATCKSLLIGYPLGVIASVVLVAIAMSSKIGDEYMQTITGAGQVLPSAFILPIAMLIFGLSLTAKTSVIAIETMFTVAIAMRAGLRSVPETRLYTGMNLGLSKLGLVFKVQIPDAMPAIIAGLKGGLGKALIVALVLEMIAGGAVGEPGLGYFVMLANNGMKAPEVYAGTVTAMVLGLFFMWVFRLIEKFTIVKYGMTK